MRKLLHALAHLTHWNRGYVTTARDKAGNIWVGFRCAKCKRVSGAHIAPPDLKFDP